MLSINFQYVIFFFTNNIFFIDTFILYIVLEKLTAKYVMRGT